METQRRMRSKRHNVERGQEAEPLWQEGREILIINDFYRNIWYQKLKVTKEKFTY